MADPNLIWGWFSAFVGMIGFGSFAVPIKGDAANSCDIDPLVMQSYKTIMCFLTSWLVVLLGQEITFTPWGIVSGLFWVPSGAMNIFAIRNAGLAISQGIVSSTLVMVSFIWGNVIFHEPAKSQVAAYSSVCLIMAGLYGMGYYSTEDDKPTESGNLSDNEESGEENEDEDLIRIKHDSFENDSVRSTPLEITQQLPRKGRTIVLFGKPYSRNKLGLCCAFVCGVWGGSSLVPMHYAPGDTKGLGFVISFAIGASTVTLLLWTLRYLNQLCKLKSPVKAYKALPSFHLRLMWLPGAAAGILWSIGNIGAIVAVERLGQGVGYPASQAALLISGLWGIFYFNEISRPSTIIKWFLSAIIAISGILLLGYESADEPAPIDPPAVPKI